MTRTRQGHRRSDVNVLTDVEIGYMFYFLLMLDVIAHGVA
ncbi:hypothetical protein FOXB_01552 [Fusarium oxysporum f. sp. conglutinans Fo5176]|uniref:Uncharacterized protein n=1 Tax=Fusarium oxysporum (strain Fo5176) TaxID=660025 RepID=F9F577_FUSOF|nr:hypothetical protein FOXB_01552 [Fusarium oxysporum f. sp. conglutinans Fo5176]